MYVLLLWMLLLLMMMLLLAKSCLLAESCCLQRTDACREILLWCWNSLRTRVCSAEVSMDASRWYRR